MLVQQYSIALATLELNACAAIPDLHWQHLYLMFVQQYSITSATLELNACAAIFDCISNT